jgi:nitrogen fixation protein NifQ
MQKPFVAGAASGADEDADAHVGVQTYRMLTGRSPADAVVNDESSFDRHVFASILAVAALQGEEVGEGVGLAAGDLATLLAQEFPAVRDIAAARSRPTGISEDDEIAMVRDLLLANRSTECETSRLLALMIARRALEPNHLWEDLGLRDRSELTRLMSRHFAPLADRNTKNMRWKRFFYRMMCEDDGFVMCSTPVCSQCNDFSLCFGEESGESRLAYQRRAAALGAPDFIGNAPVVDEAAAVSSFHSEFES